MSRPCRPGRRIDREDRDRDQESRDAEAGAANVPGKAKREAAKEERGDEEMLEVKMFAESVADQIHDYLPPEFADMQVSVEEKQKNNGVVWVGLCCKQPDMQSGPIIYMEQFYEMVQKGEPLKDVMGKIAEAVEKGCRVNYTAEKIHMDSYESAKFHLGIALVNTKANQRMLMNTPHWNIDNLSAICHVEFPMDNGTGSVRITDNHLEMWGVRSEELFADAVKNMQKSNPAVMVDMQDVFLELLVGSEEKGYNLLADPNLKTIEPAPGAMFVLSNRTKINGAAMMACPDVMEKVSGLFPMGFYILPSSVHEVIVLPKTEPFDPKELGDMVREVNRTHVEKGEVLSDCVYEYDREKGRICHVPESVERGKVMER